MRLAEEVEQQQKQINDHRKQVARSLRALHSLLNELKEVYEIRGIVAPADRTEDGVPVVQQVSATFGEALLMIKVCV